MAYGFTSAVLAALVASATLLNPQPPLTRRAPVLGLLTVPAEPAARSVASTTGPPEPTTAPTVSTLTSETGPRRVVSRPTSAPGPGTAQAPAKAGTTTITEAFSTVGATTTQPPATAPTTAEPTTTVSTTTAAPTTSLATTTSTQPTTTTTGPTTTGAEPTTTTGPAVPDGRQPADASASRTERP